MIIRPSEAHPEIISRSPRCSHPPRDGYFDQAVITPALCHNDTVRASEFAENISYNLANTQLQQGIDVEVEINNITHDVPLNHTVIDLSENLHQLSTGQDCCRSCICREHCL